MTPSVSDPAVTALLDDLARANVSVRVFGGFAVGIDPRMALLDAEADLRSPDDPVRLAAQIRNTVDVDVAVLGPVAEAEAVLRRDGFEKVARIDEPPSRWKGPLQIDLVAANAESESELERLLAFLVAQPDGAQSGGVPVFPPADLVILKAVAHRNRFARKDLADVGRIALLDELAEPVARVRLARLAPDLPVFASRALAELRRRFADEEADGASAFLQHVEAHIPGIRFEAERELHVRAAVAGAVRRMIDPALAAI